MEKQFSQGPNRRFGSKFRLVIGITLGLISMAPASAATVPELLSRAAEEMGAGNPDAARALARKAYGEAQSPADRFAAAQAVAAAHFRNDDFNLAQFWLRRAANHARSLEEANQNRDAYQLVRAANPMRVDLSFSVAPSDNINNGVDDPLFNLGPFVLVFPPEALALSGLKYEGNLNLSYRLSEDENQRTQADFSLYARGFTLSSEAKRIAPTARAGDYSYVQAGVGLSHYRNLFDGLGPTRLTGQFSRVWYGGDALRDNLRLSLWQGIYESQHSSLGVGAYVEKQSALSTVQSSALVTGIQLSTVRRFENQDQLQLSYEFTNHDAETETDTYQSHSLAASYSLSQPIAEIGLSFHSRLTHRNYDEFSLSLNGREDVSAEIGMEAVFNRFIWYGFSPSLNLTATHTWSNVDRFDTKGLQAGVTFRSRF